MNRLTQKYATLFPSVTSAVEGGDQVLGLGMTGDTEGHFCRRAPRLKPEHERGVQGE